MNRKDFNDVQNDLMVHALKVMDVKGNDYAGDVDVLANFKNNAERLGVSAETVWAIYFMKHIDAILTYVRDGKVKSEPIEGRIIDAINYLVLFAGLVKDEG